MKINITKKHLIGTAIGFISPVIFLPIVLFTLALINDYPFSFFWNQFVEYSEFTSKYISLALISNLMWFYIFLNKEEYQISRGIIFAMFCFIPYMIYVNLLS
jgi:hypothetical protein